MEVSQMYILISIIVLAIIALLLFLVRKKKAKRLTPLAGVAFGFVLAGIIFNSRWLSYGLMGVGVVIAIIDMIIKLKKK